MAATRREENASDHLHQNTLCARRENLIKVSRYCPERPYVELCVPENIVTIKTIVFRIVSHDQGEFIQSDLKDHSSSAQVSVTSAMSGLTTQHYVVLHSTIVS